MSDMALNYLPSVKGELANEMLEITKGLMSPFKVKDPISALTHFIGCMMAIFSMPLLLIHASLRAADFLSLVSLAVFMMSMILLYAASTSYHTFCVSKKANGVLKRLDHGMIFILIAGSYTPVCLTPLRYQGGPSLLLLVWSIALAGIFLKLFYVYCPRWVSSVIYIGMGWSCLLRMKAIWMSLSMSSFLWLLFGGLFYTIGGVIYSMHLKCLEDCPHGFGSHELFHLFVMAGSICHFICMYQLCG